MSVLLGLPNLLIISFNSPFTLPDLDLDLALEIMVVMLGMSMMMEKVLPTTILSSHSLLQTLSHLSVATEYPMCGPCRKVSSILCLKPN